MPWISGTVRDVRFSQGDYYVFTFNVAKTDGNIYGNQIVAGSLCGLKGIAPGVLLTFEGEWGSHHKYGMQFKPYSWGLYHRTLDDITTFLQICIGGFGDAASVLVQHYGETIYEVLAKRPDEISALSVVAEMKHLIHGGLSNWNEVLMFRSIYQVLRTSILVKPEMVRDVYRLFGMESVNIIRRNPYQLLASDLFTMIQADEVARYMGIESTDPRRTGGAILSVLRQESRNGHLYLRLGQLQDALPAFAKKEKVSDSLDCSEASLKAAVEEMQAEEIIVNEPGVGVYLRDYWFYENESANILSKFVGPMTFSFDVQAFLAEYEAKQNIQLSEAQRDAVYKLVENRVLVLTGSPGTGKTTIIRSFVQMFRRLKMTFALMAPTGIAAKRMSQATSCEAATIHRTLGYNGETWGKGAHNQLSVDAVVIDEVSMIDQELFYRTISALPPNVMIVLVGDDSQLPSVGPGNVLKELLSCPLVPHVKLTQIFRQAETSEIVVAAYEVNNGRLPELAQRIESDFQFVQLADDHKIADLVVKIATKLHERGEEFQTLSPMYDGAVGVNNLNTLLQAALNPVENHNSLGVVGGVAMRPEDRVMVVQNDYRLGVFNGDIGRVSGFNPSGGVIVVFPDHAQPVVFDKMRAEVQLKLAYAVTVHKSQGSQFDTVILPVTRSHGRMLQRNLFYTAITRAKKKVWVIGTADAVERSVMNDRVVHRNTHLGLRILSAVGANDKPS